MILIYEGFTSGRSPTYVISFLVDAEDDTRSIEVKMRCFDET